MKFSNIKELKDFLIWCKSQKMQQVSIDGMTFVFSGLALVDEDMRHNEDTLMSLEPSNPAEEEILQWIPDVDLKK